MGNTFSHRLRLSCSWSRSTDQLQTIQSRQKVLPISRFVQTQAHFSASCKPCPFKRALQPVLRPLRADLHSRQEGLLNAVEAAPAQDGGDDGARRALVVNAYATAAGVAVEGHLRNERNADAGGHHAKQAAE